MQSATPSGNVIAFRFDSAVDTNWQAYVGNGSTQTTVDTGVAPNPVLTSPGAVSDQFKIVADGSSGWNFYIDWTKVASIPAGSPGMPVSTTQMLYMMVCDAQSGDEAQLYLNGMQWCSAY
jgi:hypothetical protein